MLEIKKYISMRRTYQNAQKIAKNQLRKIKIYKFREFNSIFVTNGCLIGNEIKFNEENSKLNI